MKSSIVLSVEPGVIPQGLGGDFEQNARFIAGLGFDGAELLVVNISEVDTKRIRKIAERYRLTIPAVAAGQYYKAHGLSLATSNTEIRKKTMHKIKEFLRFTAEFNSSYIIGSTQGKYEGNYEEGFSLLKDCLQECGRVAEEQHVVILVEPVNRYIPGMIRTVEQGMRIVDAVASPAVKLMADTHHMNIEERSLTESITHAKGYLAHMHFSDSNRLAPGQGHVDYHKIAEALRDIAYEGFASAEILPEPDPLTAARLTIQLIKSLPY